MREPSTRPFGEEVALLLDEVDISQRELARRCGIHSGSISQLIKGYYNAELATMERIAHHLEVPADHFAEYRLESVRVRLDWRPPQTDRRTSERVKRLTAALAAYEAFGLEGKRALQRAEEGAPLARRLPQPRPSRKAPARRRKGKAAGGS